MKGDILANNGRTIIRIYIIKGAINNIELVFIVIFGGNSTVFLESKGHQAKC